jgi:hypothetical protein
MSQSPHASGDRGQTKPARPRLNSGLMRREAAFARTTTCGGDHNEGGRQLREEAGPNTTRTEVERARFKRLWPDEFRDGERCAFLRKFKGKRESGGFPLGFHTWPLERKNSWYCGYNIGLIERQRALVEMEAADADG